MPKEKVVPSYRGTLYEGGKSLSQVQEAAVAGKISEDGRELPRDLARAGFEKWFRAANMFPKMKHAFRNEKFDAVLETPTGKTGGPPGIGDQVIFQMKFSVAWVNAHLDIKAFDFPDDGDHMVLVRKEPPTRITFKVDQLTRDLKKLTRAVFIVFGTVLEYEGA